MIVENVRPVPYWTEFSVTAWLNALPARALRVMGTVIALLLCASMAGQIALYILKTPGIQGVAHLFYVEDEGNIPTWFSSMLLLLCALASGCNAVCARFLKTSESKYWSGLSALIALFSLDELVSLHEKLNTPMRYLVGHHGLFHYSWIAFGGVAVAAISFSFYRFFTRLPHTVKRVFLLGCVLYFGGALGMEAIGGIYSDRFGAFNFPYTLLATLEEGLEMTGSLVVLSALLQNFALQMIYVLREDRS